MHGVKFRLRFSSKSSIMQATDNIKQNQIPAENFIGLLLTFLFAALGNCRLYRK